MSKTLTIFKQHLHALHEIYVIPAETAAVTRAEIRSIVKTVSFTSNVAGMRYEDLQSASALSK